MLFQKLTLDTLGIKLIFKEEIYTKQEFFFLITDLREDKKYFYLEKMWKDTWKELQNLQSPVPSCEHVKHA